VVLAPVTARAIDDYLAGRETDPCLSPPAVGLSANPAAFRMARRLARAAGLGCARPPQSPQPPPCLRDPGL
jgi:hypothetical protein